MTITQMKFANVAQVYLLRPSGGFNKTAPKQAGRYPTKPLEGSPN